MDIPSQQIGAVTVFFGDRKRQVPGRQPGGGDRGRAARGLRHAPWWPTTSDRARRRDAVIPGMHEDHMAACTARCARRYGRTPADRRSRAAGLARHYGYPIATSERLRAMIEARFHYHPRPDARAYADGQRWELWRRRDRHGLSPAGSHQRPLALLVEPDGVAFYRRHIDLTGFGPLRRCHLPAWRPSGARCARCRTSRPAWVNLPHHRGVVSERATFLAHLAAFGARIDERSERLLQMLADGPPHAGGRWCSVV